MWMRLTERVREFIPKAGCRMLRRTVCNGMRGLERSLSVVLSKYSARIDVGVFLLMVIVTTTLSHC